MRWLLLFTVFRLFAGSFDDLAPSSPEEILSLNSDLFIEGYVSAASGQIVLSETDLRVKGAQDLVLKRTYVPPQILGRYEDIDPVDHLSLGKALVQLETKGWVVLPHLFSGYNRNSPYFQLRDPQGFVLEFEIQKGKGILRSSAYGCSNLRGEQPCSEGDIRNIELFVEDNGVKVIWPSGVRRFYANSETQSRVFRLEQEILPNGKIIRYEYNKAGLTEITSSDPSGKYIYASIEKIGDQQYLGSDGSEAQLFYDTHIIGGAYKKGGYSEKATFHFPVMKRASNPVYTNTVGYNNRTLLNSYDGRAFPISCSYTQEKNVISCIQTFSTPSGSTSFSYDPPAAGRKGGFTKVVYPDGAETIYRFNKLLLLSAIENWFEGKLINEKTFGYDHKQHIEKIEIRDGAGNLLLVKRFECDSAGNPTLEVNEGDFGTFSIRRKFDCNRLVSEIRDDGLQYIFTYLEGTHLVTSKTTCEFGTPLRKTTYTYDDAYNLILEEEENKLKTHYLLYQKKPHLHLVEWEEKYDWEENLIHKIHYAYDSWNNRAEEAHFGSDGLLAYTVKRVYNAKGELLEETNPLGQTALYKYDERGRCYYEEPFSNGLAILRIFDEKGRVVVLNESNHETRFAYNASDELIEKTDYLGHTTKYHYHPVHSKPDRIVEGEGVTQFVYDAFGREKECVDPFGAMTAKSYNSYGSVVKTIYPEGGEEICSYAPNGLLASHKDPDGLATTYSRDALGRITKETVGGLTSEFLYDGYNLLQAVDPAGFTTKYRYDFSDRNIEEVREGRKTCYEYDPLGYLSAEERMGRRIEYLNDPLGQVLKKSIDGRLETAWTYDGSGNVASIERGGVTSFRYDPHNRLIYKNDPGGNITRIRYEERAERLIKRTVDPAGIETVETYNPRGQRLQKEVAGQCVEECSYDRLFRLNKQDHLTFGYTPDGNKAWVKEGEARITKWTYTPGGRVLSQEKPDGTLLMRKYDAQMRPIKIGSREFCYDNLDRIVGGSGFARTLDPFGNIAREEWSTGLSIESGYDDWDRPIERRLPDGSRVAYKYQGPFLKMVARVSSGGKELYSHTYDRHDARGNPQLETGLFETTYQYDACGRRVGQHNPYFKEIVAYDPSGRLIRKGKTTYTYDAQSQMTSESGRFTADYDAHYNLIELNGTVIQTDPLNQIEGMSYDRNGNLLQPGFVYDPFDQLIETASGQMVYDALGRRLTQGDTSFLYLGDEEIGAFENGAPKELKIPGATTPVALEIEDKPYAPIMDVQGVARLLIDWETGDVAQKNSCDAFGSGLTDAIPYAYLGKRYDPSTGLVYFGQRHYAPSLHRWLTPDPLGAIDHSNLYQYVFNNPFMYRDHTGEFVFAIPFLLWGAELALPAISACITTMIYGAAVGAVAYGGYKLVEAMNEQNARDIKIPNISWKNTDVYAPDRPLPLTEHGIPRPETDAPHTELGVRDGSKGKYPQAREFDKDGKPVRDIDFTDHGYPSIHPNPHQHRPKPNPTGGTPQRGGAEPIDNWSY